MCELDVSKRIDMITPEENLILQSYITTSLLVELGNNNFFASQYFESMNFGQPAIKEILRNQGIDNQGCAIMSLYAMLVVPYELIRTKHPSDFSSMNKMLLKNVRNVTTTYHDCASKSDFLYHLRNAVAHCRITFKDGDCMLFSDSNPSGKKQFQGELPLEQLSHFFHKLQGIQLKVIKDVQSRKT